MTEKEKDRIIEYLNERVLPNIHSVSRLMAAGARTHDDNYEIASAIDAFGDIIFSYVYSEMDCFLNVDIGVNPDKEDEK